MSALTTALNKASDAFSTMQGVAQSNNAASAEQAQIQRDWQVQQNAKAMEFNRLEAEKNRNWQEMMSNTAHQREVADLKAAGLNPVLSAMGGNGASVTSGATASGVTSSGAKGEIDTSLNGALVNLLGTMINTANQIEIANINARTQEAVADKYTAMSKITAEIAAAASKYSSDQSKEASKYAADKKAESDQEIAEYKATTSGNPIEAFLANLVNLLYDGNGSAHVKPSSNSGSAKNTQPYGSLPQDQQKWRNGKYW